MTRMTRPDYAVMCNLINTHTHTHTHICSLFALATQPAEKRSGGRHVKSSSRKIEPVDFF